MPRVYQVPGWPPEPQQSQPLQLIGWLPHKAELCTATTAHARPLLLPHPATLPPTLEHGTLWQPAGKTVSAIALIVTNTFDPTAERKVRAQGSSQRMGRLDVGRTPAMAFPTTH